VSNVVEANLLAVAAEGVSGEVFNLACGASLSLNEIVSLVSQALGLKPNIIHGPRRPGDVLHSQASIEAARSRLSYRPVVSAQEGLTRLLECYR